MTNNKNIQHAYDNLSKKVNEIIKDNFNDIKTEEALAMYMTLMIQEIEENGLLSDALFKVDYWNEKASDKIVTTVKVSGKKLANLVINLDKMDQDLSFKFDLVGSFNIN